MTDDERTSEQLTFAQVLALVGSSGHDAGDADYGDLRDALGEAHPAVAGKLVEQLTRSLNDDTGTASGSEHPDWHDSLDLAKKWSDERGYDI